MADVMPGNGPSMAGNLESTAADAAAVEAGVAQAMADMKMNQASAGRFIQEYGAAVVDGHAPAEGPGGKAGSDYDD